MLIKSFVAVDLFFANRTYLLVICFHALIAHYYVPAVKNNCVPAWIIADYAKFIVGNINTLALKKFDLRLINVLSHFYIFDDFLYSFFDIFIDKTITDKTGQCQKSYLNVGIYNLIRQIFNKLKFWSSYHFRNNLSIFNFRL